MDAQGRMVIVSGPSGSGKSSIVRRLVRDPRVVFSVSATTRPPRAGEVDGRDYVFLTPQEFARRRRRGEFLEQAEVHGNMYGTLASQMEDALALGRIFLLEIDVQGANQIKAQRIPCLSIFVVAPSPEELRRRLIGRGTDSPEVIERRLKKAEDELREGGKYDHVVVNDDLERALSEVRALMGLEERAPRALGGDRS